MNAIATEHVFLTAAFYKFVELPDFQEMKPLLLAFCEAHHVKGMILLAREGINSTIAGKAQDVYAVLAYLRADKRLADLEHKESFADAPPFHRMKVRLKKEIVTMGVDGISPTHMAGAYVKPQDWNALISDPDVVLIDTRNDYEVEIGTFAGAINPDIQTFSQLPAWVEKARELSAKSFGPATAKYRELGTVSNLLVFNRLSVLPTRNFQEGHFAAIKMQDFQEVDKAAKVTRHSCAACTIGCEHIYESKLGKVRIEYESMFALGSLC
jgi:rhodanese-related sulfurtransferase